MGARLGDLPRNSGRLRGAWRRSGLPNGKGRRLLSRYQRACSRLPSLHSVGGIRQTVWVQFVGANVDDDSISAGDATAFSVLKRSSREQSLHLVYSGPERKLPRALQIRSGHGQIWSRADREL
jgi:hypothetical protein